MDGFKLELFIPGELKEQPVIFQMIKEFDIKVKIIEASFSAESGWALLIVDGEKPELKRLLDSLIEKGIKIELRD